MCVVANTTVDLILLSFLVKKQLDIIALQSCKYYHFLSGFSSTFQLAMTIIHPVNVRMLNIPKANELKINWNDNIYV